MTQYEIHIPKPKAARMAVESREVSITLSSGWGGSQLRTHILPANVTRFIFDVPDKAQYAGTCKTIDALVFDVSVEFFNSTRTRSEIAKPVPTPFGKYV